MCGCSDKGFGADDHGADGGAEALGEAEGDGVEALTVGLETLSQGPAVLAFGNLGRDGFPDAGTVKVHFYVVGSGEA